MSEAVFIFTPSHSQQKYLDHVLDSIASQLSIPYRFCLFTDRLSPDFRSRHDLLIKLVERGDLERMEAVYFKEGRGDIPAFSAYAQFVLPRYFSEFKSFIYMEVDQLVCGDLAPLWIECVDGNRILAAAAFLDDDFSETTTSTFDKIHRGKRCYNTGVLYVDVKHWLNNGFEEVCFKEAEAQKNSGGRRLQFYAQGAIVNVLHPYISEFSWRYNTPGFGSVRGISEEIIRSAVVLHWTGPLKPWLDHGLYKDLYYSDPEIKNRYDYEVKFPMFQRSKIRFKRSVRAILRRFV